jgi:hypothetical protein
MTFGVLPPRALRMVAILLMFTLSAIMYSKLIVQNSAIIELKLALWNEK